MANNTLKPPKPTNTNLLRTRKNFKSLLEANQPIVKSRARSALSRPKSAIPLNKESLVHLNNKIGTSAQIKECLERRWESAKKHLDTVDKEAARSLTQEILLELLNKPLDLNTFDSCFSVIAFDQDNSRLDKEQMTVLIKNIVKMRETRHRSVKSEQKDDNKSVKTTATTTTIQMLKPQSNPVLSQTHSRQSIKDLQLKVVVAKLLKQYSPEKLFDKRECLKFLNEVVKHVSADGPKPSLLKFDQWFNALDRLKRGALELN